jgi:ketosteroid isomerase-like protein
MSQENVEVVRTVFETLSRGGFDEALAYVDPEVEFEPPDEAVESPAGSKGHDALRERWKTLLRQDSADAGLFAQGSGLRGRRTAGLRRSGRRPARRS